MFCMEQFKSDLIPFAIEDLRESHISKTKRPGKLFEAASLPNKIIRSEGVDELSHKHGDRIETSELVEDARRLYRELQDEYTINAPVKFYTGNDIDNNQVVYSVVDKIEGKHFDKVQISDEFVSKAEGLYASVSRYFLDKQNDDGLHLWDICGQSQYVYGRRSGEQEDRIFLIDTDIWLSKSKAGLYLCVEWLTRHMTGVEGHLKVKFIEARDNIAQFVSLPLPENLSDFERENIGVNIDHINDFLNGKKLGPSPKTAIPPFE